jgi:hypothetical protein
VRRVLPIRNSATEIIKIIITLMLRKMDETRDTGPTGMDKRRRQIQFKNNANVDEIRLDNLVFHYIFLQIAKPN